jgi:mRNA interferase MazF
MIPARAEARLMPEIRRGDVWTVSGGTGYGGKPRPAVIVQDDEFGGTHSITICSFTTDETDAPLFRPRLEPNQRNGLHASCRVMVDKIASVPKVRLGGRIGRLDDNDILRLNRAIVVFLGLAASSRTRPET